LKKERDSCPGTVGENVEPNDLKAWDEESVQENRFRICSLDKILEAPGKERGLLCCS